MPDKKREETAGAAAPGKDSGGEEQLAPQVEAEATPQEDDGRAVEEQLAEAKAQAAEYLDGWQRARAELANFRKRTERERGEWESTLRGSVIAQLLPILDDFDRAMDNLPPDGQAQEWVEGIALIHRKLQNQLAELGVTEIEAQGKPFDPELAEALMQRESPDHPSGEVIEVVRKGYLIDGRVLRPAMVVVAA